MIIANERDKQTAAWLVKQYGTDAIERAEKQLAGTRKSILATLPKYWAQGCLKA